jgi:hypothetical protein
VNKQELLDLLRDFPEEFDTDELMYRLYLTQKLSVAEQAAAAGEVISHEEVVRRTAEWSR